MRRLFQDLTKRLQAFVAQRDTLVLLVRCRDEESSFILKTLDSIDEASQDIFWSFVEEFSEPVTYADAIVRSFRQRAEALAKKLEEAGDPSWPPLPPRATDVNVPPAARLQALFMYARTRIPDLEASHLVVALMPLRVTDPLRWRAFLRELTAHDPLSPWCHHMRIVAREGREISMDDLSPELQARLDPSSFPRTDVYEVDFSLEALQRATKAEIADPSVPLPDRMQSLLVDANVDYAHKRYDVALEKYGLLRTFYAAVQNQALLAATLNGIGEVYARAGHRDLAIQHFEMALTAAIEGSSHPILLNVSLNLGNLYLAEKSWALAADHYVGSEALATALLNAHVKLLCLENIGVCRFELADYGAAQEAWQNGASLARALEEQAALKRVLARLRNLYVQANMRDRVKAIDDELRGVS
jgi:tetratricopeptide (TPR) repeat protein